MCKEKHTTKHNMTDSEYQRRRYHSYSPPPTHTHKHKMDNSALLHQIIIIIIVTNYQSFHPIACMPLRLRTVLYCSLSHNNSPTFVCLQIVPRLHPRGISVA